MKKSLSKISSRKIFKQFITQSFIELEEFLYKMPVTLECILIVIGSIQKTTFFMHIENLNTFNQLPYFISMICNPTFFILNAQNVVFETYCFLLVIIMLFFYLESSIILFKQEILRKKTNFFNISCLTNYNLLERLLFYYSAYFSQLLLTVLIFPLTQLLSISYQASLNDIGALKYLIIIICLILLIIIFGLALFKQSVSLESSNIVPQGFNLLLVTNFQAVQFVIMIFQICLEYFFNNNYMYLQAIACLIASLLEVIELFCHYTQPNFRKVRAKIFAQSYCIIIALYFIISTIFNVINNDLVVLVIIIQPLLFRVILFYYEDTRFLTLFKIQSNAHPKVQQFQLNLLLTEFHGCYINPQIVRAMLIHQHISECEDTLCFCRKIVGKTNVPKYAQAMLPEHEIQLILRLSQNFLHSLTLLEVQDQAVYYIHYISMINNLGQSSQAYNQIGILMEGKSHKKKKGKVKQSEVLVALGLYKQNSFSSQKSYVDVEQDDQKKIQKVALSGIYKIKIQILKQRAKSCIRQYLVIQNESQDQLSDSVQRFMKTEEANVKLKQRILRVVLMKIAFLKMINQEEEMEKGTSIYQNTFKLIRKMVKLNEFIEQLYLQFPSLSIQSVYSFYSAEIMNDYLQAFNIINTGGINNSKVKEKSKRINFDLLNSKSTYINLEIDDSTYDLKIIGASKNAHQFFGFTFDEFAKVTSPSSIIPSCVWATHDNIVKNFFNTGKSKYFRQTALAFAHIKSGALKKIDAFYDIDFKKDNFVAQLFLFESLNESAYIVAGMNNSMSGITENILSLLQFKDTSINQVFKIFSQIHIKYFIPQWKFILNKLKNSDQKDNQTRSTKQQGTIDSFREIQTFFDMEFIFISEKRLKQLIDEHQNLTKLKEEALDQWKNQQNLIVYSASLIVNKQSIENMFYYIVEINDLKINNIQRYQQQQTQNQSNKDLNELYSSSNQDIEQINRQQKIPLDEMALLLKQFDLSQCDISQEELPNPPNIAQNIGYDLSQDVEDLKFGVKLQPLQQSTNRQMVSSRVDKQLINSILSPKISQSKPLINEKFFSASVIKGKQQRFYKDHEEVSVQPSFENFKRSENENNFNQFKVEQDGQDQSYVKDMKIFNNEDNLNEQQYEASSISSAAGVRNSRFFKKYSNLHQYYLQNSQSSYFEIFIRTIAMSLLISLTYVLLEFATFQPSSNFLLDVLDTLSIQQTVMGPVDQILLTVDSIDRYNQLKKQYPNQKEFFQNLQNYSIKSLPTYITQFKNKYRKQLKSAQMGFLLEDLPYHTIKGINLTQISNETLSLISILNIVDMKLDDIYLKLSQNFSADVWQIKSFQFSIINFDLLNEIFHYLKHKTIQLAHLNVDQWTKQEDIIFYILLSLFLFASVISLLFNLLHRYRIEEFLQLFQKIDQNHLKKDQERFKIINKLLTRDIDVMFKYRFELTDKEKAILQYEKAQEYNMKTKENKKQANKLQIKKNFNSNKKSSIFYFIITCAISVSVLSYMHVQIQYYLKAFKISTDIYSMISDKSSNLPESYCIKSTAYNTLNPNFPIGAFFDHTVYEEVITEVSLVEMDQLIQFLTHLDSSMSQSLTTPDLFSFFQEENEYNVCDMFNEQKQAETYYFCHTAFEGALSRGLVQAINTVKQSLQNEYEVNHLTIAPEKIAFGENEALNILLEVFIEISDEFQLTIRSQTKTYQIILYVSGSLFLSYVTLHFLFLKLFYYDLNLKEYQIIKKCYILLPSMSLMIDLQLERKLRLLYWQEKT